MRNISLYHFYRSAVAALILLPALLLVFGRIQEAALVLAPFLIFYVYFTCWEGRYAGHIIRRRSVIYPILFAAFAMFTTGFLMEWQHFHLADYYSYVLKYAPEVALYSLIIGYSWVLGARIFAFLLTRGKLITS